MLMGICHPLGSQSETVKTIRGRPSASPSAAIVCISVSLISPVGRYRSAWRSSAISESASSRDDFSP